jgi:hypothetical protein
MNPQQTPMRKEVSLQALTPEMQRLVKGLDLMPLEDLPFHLRLIHDHVVHHSTTDLDENLRTSLYHLNWLAMELHGAHVMGGR